ncbi:hypothetical protein TNCT_362151 [Trichonephila clavata]|uniref:Uncharacterized protein n=1 Tax=Trichonephila clavata TaxID=2740835 RepID=A0A8X6EYM9_TRICU|nr:hypothetical protein TNCT_362151 [Trichonephila clavata]
MSCVLNLPQKEKSRMPVMAAIVKAPPSTPLSQKKKMEDNYEATKGKRDRCGEWIFLKLLFSVVPLKDFFIHPGRDVFVSEKPIFVESRRRENENRN